MKRDRDDKGNNIQEINKSHQFTVSDRKRLTMSGVKEVLSYDEHLIQLETVQGPCLIKGTKMIIQQLSLEQGNLMVEGEFTTIDYSTKGTKGFFNKVFK